MKVPFVDLKRQYKNIQDEIMDGVKQVLQEASFSGGPFVEQFEKAFASFCGCRYAIATGSGTEALWLALHALGVRQGDEVITVPNTFIATAEAISFNGAHPVFVDVEEHTYNMNPALIEPAITPRTKAILPVHLYGQMANMDPMMDIARKYGLFVVEDACQAHGAEYRGRRAGSIGDAGCFSFYPSKNLGAYGEGGAVVTNNAELDKKIRMIRDHGQVRKYVHDLIGWNARMDGLQGAILSVKLKHLPVWNEARRNHARLYNQSLKDLQGITVPKESDYAKHIYHLYAIRVPHRDALMNGLMERGVSCGLHYPVPIHLQGAYQFMGLKEGSYPVAETCAKELLSLPLFPELTPAEVNHVSNTLEQLVRRKPSSG